MKIVTIKETFEESSGIVSELVPEARLCRHGIIWVLKSAANTANGSLPDGARAPATITRRSVEI